MRLSIRHQIVTPFVVLVLFVGVVGTAVAIAQFTSATTVEFDGSLLRASMLANDHLALLEADRLARLRAAADTLGVSDAVAAGDRAALERLLVPIEANAQPARLTIRALGRQGQELLAIKPDGPGGTPFAIPGSGDYSSEPAVQEALAGRADAAGDKYLFLAAEAPGLVLYWVGPVRDDSQSVVGALLLGDPLSDIAAGIQGSRASELVFYDRGGHVLRSSLLGVPALRPEVMQRITEESPVRATEKLSGRSYGLLAGDWRMRGRQLGYLGVLLNADPLHAQLNQLRVVLVALFAGAALLALLAGILLATRITRPIERLVASTQAVSAGDLSHRIPIGTQAPIQDEIGQLSRSFNAMTASLERNQKQLEALYFASLEVLARAIDARDPYTFEHSTRVAAISLEIADAMGLPAEARTALRRSGLLHDIGKIGVEDRILAKDGPLTEEEWEAIRRHPVIGYDMVKDLPFLTDCLPGIRHHHERWDGEGYPDGLKGEAIPLPVRILSVADAFDAMTSDRPYRKQFSFEFAARALRTGAASQFDPAAVEAFESRAEAIIAMLNEMRKAPRPHASDSHWREQAA